MSKDRTLREEFADLASVLDTERARTKPVHHVWFDPNSKPDAVHVGQIRDFGRARLHALPRGDHDVAEMLQKR